MPIHQSHPVPSDSKKASVNQNKQVQVPRSLLILGALLVVGGGLTIALPISNLTAFKNSLVKNLDFCGATTQSCPETAAALIALTPIPTKQPPLQKMIGDKLYIIEENETGMLVLEVFQDGKQIYPKFQTLDQLSDILLGFLPDKTHDFWFDETDYKLFTVNKLNDDADLGIEIITELHLKPAEVAAQYPPRNLPALEKSNWSDYSQHAKVLASNDTNMYWRSSILNYIPENDYLIVLKSWGDACGGGGILNRIDTNTLRITELKKISSGCHLGGHNMVVISDRFGGSVDDLLVLAEITDVEQDANSSISQYAQITRLYTLNPTTLRETVLPLPTDLEGYDLVHKDTWPDIFQRLTKTAQTKSFAFADENMPTDEEVVLMRATDNFDHYVALNVRTGEYRPLTIAQE